MLGGFEGGVPSGSLVSQGYATLFLAYFGVTPLPSPLEEIPVETVTRAVDWLSSRPEVDPARIGVIGVSKGGELALVAAVRDPRISRSR